ncbi:hypothetical protein GCM10012275_37430 [Longimycelium tulufanense]|uniref:Uncharacterized protein n=1 Tax=Longimycelium tulufanense TaxID=907463 RepID=A0A8J3FW43_9PSEU|nr:hypothetical protein [Longimycelium tulufanense]GGM63340.1 hypothetical protein GCM10012275_37430 [Longimycelium tulufanense]
MRRVVIATLAGILSALLPVGLFVAPAQAAEGPDVGVGVTRTGGIQGVFGSGNGFIKNTGTTTIPAGVQVKFDVSNHHNVPPEVHAITIFSTDGKSLSQPVGVAPLVPGYITTTQPLQPGEQANFVWTVYHYAPWHRVTVKVDLVKMPDGITDTDPSNNSATEDNGGQGV